MLPTLKRSVPSPLFTMIMPNDVYETKYYPLHPSADDLDPESHQPYHKITPGLNIKDEDEDSTFIFPKF